MRTLIVAVSLVFIGLIAKAQDNDLTGKWKFAKIFDKNKNEYDLRDKEGSNKKILEKAKADDSDFTQEDSMMVVFGSKMLFDLFSDATMEFKNDGTYEFVTQMEMGGRKKAPEQGTYTIDKSSKTVTTSTAKGGSNIQSYELKDGLLYLTAKKEGMQKDMTVVLIKEK